MPDTAPNGNPGLYAAGRPLEEYPILFSILTAIGEVGKFNNFSNWSPQRLYSLMVVMFILL